MLPSIGDEVEPVPPEEITSDPALPLVTILLSTFNGVRYLDQQLRSFEHQTVRNWRLIVADDGSTDATVAVLEAFQNRLGKSRVAIKNGPREGFVRNFLSLAATVVEPTDHYAFSDQDDVWDPERLERALRALEPHSGRGGPCLYGARTALIDDEGRDLGFSPLFKRPPSFRNALVQSIAGGNTMVFNEGLRRLIAQIGADVDVPSHDWWLYLITSGVGGAVVYDPVPTVRYRVHDGNLVGSNVGLSRQALRWRQALGGRFVTWNYQNISALERCRGLLSPANEAALDQFRTARSAPLGPRLLGVWRSGVHRQTFVGNIALAAAALLKRL